MKSRNLKPMVQITAIHGSTLVINRTDIADKQERAKLIRSQTKKNQETLEKERKLRPLQYKAEIER